MLRALRSKLSDPTEAGEGVRRHCQPWSPEEDAIIREQYPKSGPDFIWAELGRTRQAVVQRACKLGALYGSGHRIDHTPSVTMYLEMLKAECDRSNVNFWTAVTKSQEWAVARARWRTWARLREMNYSLPAIGSAANRDHTSILHGLRRLKELASREAQG